nr:AmmeMemoRadiSam system protein B [Desulfobacterales bacterium]
MEPQRTPAVANLFYPGSDPQLRKELSGFITRSQNPDSVLGAIVPHAGYVYSGAVAGAVFSQIQIPDSVIILGPNHRGIGAKIAVSAYGVWEMPMGSVPIDSKLAENILKECSSIVNDPQAHSVEHSIEVEVPFLQYLNSDVSIVPICVSHCSYETCQEIGTNLAKVIKAYDREVLLVASTDMTHYESQAIAKRNDQLAIDQILALHPEGLYKTVEEHMISMCGVIPTTILLEACLVLGSKEARLIQYATSGDVSGDYSQVVGYAGLIVY